MHSTVLTESKRLPPELEALPHPADVHRRLGEAEAEVRLLKRLLPLTIAAADERQARETAGAK